MTDTLLVTVTQEDIDNGQRGNPCYCPIALALQRALPTATYVRVQKAKAITSTRLTDYREWLLPGPAAWFVRGYDAGHDVQPNSFTLKLRPMP